jgi:hypothetical protein
MTLRTLSDVRKLIGHMPKDFRDRSTWQHVAAQVDAAARGGDVTDAVVALQLVLIMENVPVQPK